MTKEYSFFHGLIKTLTNLAVFGLPLAAQLLPQAWMNVTIGGLIYMFSNYLKVKNQIANS